MNAVKLSLWLSLLCLYSIGTDACFVRGEKCLWNNQCCVGGFVTGGALKTMDFVLIARNLGWHAIKTLIAATAIATGGLIPGMEVVAKVFGLPALKTACAAAKSAMVKSVVYCKGKGKCVWSMCTTGSAQFLGLATRNHINSWWLYFSSGNDASL